MANSLALDALTALGDPTRRELIQRLAQGPRPVGELAGPLAVTRLAVSQHLRVLKEAGLVTDTVQGTRRIYRLDKRGIRAIHAWLDELWADALRVSRGASDPEF